MATGRIASNLSVGGIAFGSTITRTAEGNISHEVSLPAGFAGAISSAATGGVDGLVTGHGLVGNDYVDIHWTVAGVAYSMRGRQIDSASTNAVVLKADPAGEGTALPAEDTAVIISKQVAIDTVFEGDDIEIIATKSTRNAVVDVRDSSGSELLLDLVAEEAWWWASDQGVANPLDSDTVASILASNASTTIGTLYIGVLYQSVE